MKTLLLILAGGLLIFSEAMADDCPTPSIGLALGSGGAAGLAHIAMLEVFEELDLQPKQLAGTSIGAIIAVMHAAELDSAAIRDFFKEFGGSALDPLSGLGGGDNGPDWRDLLDINFNEGGLFDAGPFLEFLGEQFDAREFEALAVPVKVVATDYYSGQSHVFDSGELMPAIRASMAVPGLFKPVKMDGKLLIDGGTSNPLPHDLLEDVDLVVAVDVTGSRPKSDDDQPGLTDLLFKSFEIMQQSIIRARNAIQSPDIFIEVAAEDIRLMHFDRVDEVIEQSQAAANELREALREHLSCD